MAGQHRRSLPAMKAELVDHLADEGFAALERGDLAHADACLHHARETAGEDPEVLFLAAHIAWERDGSAAAVQLLERVVALAPGHADARHALALAYEERGGPDAFLDMVEQNLEVLRLDQRADASFGLGTPAQLEFIERTAEQVLDQLPARFRDRLTDVPIVLEPRPTPGIVADGLDPRALGLFEGPDDRGVMMGEVALQPTRIVLFFANLLATFPDEELLAEQIEITILHEIGHFFGLDEHEVEKLGLG